MTQHIKPEDLATYRDALLSEIIASEALVNLLERKGIVTRQELTEEINRVQESLLKAEA